MFLIALIEYQCLLVLDLLEDLIAIATPNPTKTIYWNSVHAGLLYNTIQAMFSNYNITPTHIPSSQLRFCPIYPPPPPPSFLNYMLSMLQHI